MKSGIVLPLVVAGVAAAVLAAVLVPVPVSGQAGAVKPGSPAYTVSVSSNALPPPDPKFGGVINADRRRVEAVVAAADRAAQGRAQRAPHHARRRGLRLPRAPSAAPFPTPHMDRIAKAGLRYTHFHSTSLCSPTRAALITGRNHHSVALRHRRRRGDRLSRLRLDHQQGHRHDRRDPAATTATRRPGSARTTTCRAGSRTQAGPFDQWPIGMGFEYFYGFVGGDTSQWQPNLFRNTTPIAPYEGNPGWNLITAMADDAIGYMQSAERDRAGQAVLRLLRARRARTRRTTRPRSGSRSSRASSTTATTRSASGSSPTRSGSA